MTSLALEIVVCKTFSRSINVALPFLPTVDGAVPPQFGGVQRNPRAVILYFSFRCPAASTQTRPARYRETKHDTAAPRRGPGGVRQALLAQKYRYSRRRREKMAVGLRGHPPPRPRESAGGGRHRAPCPRLAMLVTSDPPPEPR